LLVYLVLTCAVLNTLVLQFDFCELSNIVFSLSAIQGYGVKCWGYYVLAYVLCNLLCDSADFHDYHHRLLYTKSGNYSSTFTYMDW
jgi:sterol desaturase/sphingolipid hydroxylase (fatty acid hydroxylase superfamily)